MERLRLRETSITDIINQSLNQISVPENVEIKFLSEIKIDSVWLDSEKIISALANLERNSIEAMPNGGSLTITLKETGDIISITLTDTGSGISTENMQLLFTPFFSTKQPGEATGLGLSETYGIIKAHKGNISIESNNDSGKGHTGTKIFIKLPRTLIPHVKKENIILH